MSSPPFALAFARYRFSFRLRTALQLPAYAGSLLRGQFGAALRHVACMTGAPRCDGCSLLATCPYPAIFETPAPTSHAMQRFSQVPNPYVLEPPPLGTRQIAAHQQLSFSLVLIGDACRQLPLVVFALQRALQRGLGPPTARTSGDLEEVAWQRGDDAWNPTHYEPVWQQGDQALASHSCVRALPPPSHAPLRLVFHTPLRLQHQGKPLLPAALSPRKFIADLLRRITLLAEFHAAQPALIPDVHELVALAETLEHHPKLSWQDWSRYSSRQQQTMTLGGAVGEWTFNGDLARLTPWLWLGQWLHVGKNATMGLGHYSLQKEAENT